MSEWAEQQGEGTGSGDEFGYQQDAQEIAQHLGPQLADMVQDQIAQRDEAYALIAEYPQIAETPEASQQFMDRVEAYAQQIGADPNNAELQRAVAKVEYGGAQASGGQGAGEQQAHDTQYGDDAWGAAVGSLGRGSSVLPFR